MISTWIGDQTATFAIPCAAAFRFMWWSWKEYFYHSFLLTILTGSYWAQGPLFYPEEGLPAHIISNLSHLTHIDPEIETASLSDSTSNVTLLQLSDQTQLQHGTNLLFVLW